MGGTAARFSYPEGHARRSSSHVAFPQFLQLNTFIELDSVAASDPEEASLAERSERHPNEGCASLNSGCRLLRKVGHGLRPHDAASDDPV